MLMRKILFVCGVLVLGQTVITAETLQDKRISFSVPAAPWTLTLPADDFKVRQKNVKPDGRYGYFYLTDDRQNLNVSFFIEPVDKCRDSKACRDMVWKAGNPMWENPKNVVLSEIGDVSVLQFLLPSLQGKSIQQQNMYAEFVVDGFWVDFHLSKVLYKPEEHELFERLIKSIKFETKQNSKS